MKKGFIILIAAFFLTATSTYAAKKEGDIPQYVVSAFNNNFYFAGNVQWQKMDNYYEVIFNQHGKTLFAFYSEDADFMGIANYILSDRLPVTLKSDLNTKYSNYWISDLFTYSINDKPGYVVTLENADQKIMLKSDNGKTWHLYRSVRIN
ncbi:MAG TPA: hypothetical protein VGZ90_02755 [Puia sp.]|jgi:hypothetical protein|nr:hypothetical protein [Puia sp.]